MIHRYDVLANRGERRGSPDLMVVLSSPHLLDIDVMIVAPLFSPHVIQADAKLNIAVEHNDIAYTVCVPLLKGVSTARRWSVVGSLGAYADDFDRASDRLFTGF